MKRILLFFLIAGCICPILCVAQTDLRENQLTGTFYAAKGKADAYLEIDGPGEFRNMVLTGAPIKGAPIKDIPDGSRIWVKGQIKSWVQGSEPGAAQFRHWLIAMIVERWEPIKVPFEVPNLK
jgi:hypothetical protein